MATVQELLTELHEGNVEIVFNQACEHYEKGELDKAIYWWERIAEDGDGTRQTDAVVDLMYIYAYSERSSRDKLVKWMKIGANVHACPKAMVSLGALFCGKPEIVHAMWGNMFNDKELLRFRDTQKAYELIEKGLELARIGELDFIDYIAVAYAYHYKKDMQPNEQYTIEELQEIKYHYEVALWHTKTENLNTLNSRMKAALLDTKKQLSMLEDEITIRRSPTSKAPDDVVAKLEKAIRYAETKPLQVGIEGAKTIIGIMKAHKEKYPYDEKIIELYSRSEVAINRLKGLIRFANANDNETKKMPPPHKVKKNASLSNSKEEIEIEIEIETEKEAETEMSEGNTVENKDKNKNENKNPISDNKVDKMEKMESEIDQQMLDDFFSDVNIVIKQCGQIIKVNENQLYDPESVFFSDTEIQKTLLDSRIRNTLADTKRQYCDFYDKVISSMDFVKPALDSLREERLERLKPIDYTAYQDYTHQIDDILNRHGLCVSKIERVRELVQGYGTLMG